MFVCVDCAAIFEEPKRIVERHGFDRGPYESLYRCPVCGGDFVETTRCAACGDYITGKFAIINDSECYCENCYELRDIRDA